MTRRWLLPLIVLVVALALALLSCEEERAAPDRSDAPAEPEPPAPPRERVRVTEPRVDEAPVDEPSASEPGPAAGDPEPLPGPEGTVPGDVRGTGDATLRLRVVDAGTLEPVEGRVVLWRIGAAEHGVWSAGDHIQSTVDLGDDGVRIESLPPGMYRAHCELARRGADDPPAFGVTSGENDVVLRVDAPRTVPVRALVFTHLGEPVETAMSRVHRRGYSSSRSPRAPDWANVRRHATRAWALGFGGRGGGTSGISMRLAKHDGTWFDLGSMTEATRRDTTRRTVDLTPDGGSTVKCLIRGHTIRPRAVFVGTSAPLADLLSAVTTSDGTPVLAAGANVEASTEGWLVDEEVAHGSWRGFEIGVTVTLGGHEELSFKWRVGDPWPVHRMVALPE